MYIQYVSQSVIRCSGRLKHFENGGCEQTQTGQRWGLSCPSLDGVTSGCTGSACGGKTVEILQQTQTKRKRLSLCGLEGEGMV